MTVVQRLSDRLLSETISKRMLASGYKMIRPLGEGTYGTVWLAEEENTSVHVAIKFFAHGTGQQWQMLQDEVRQLAVLDDANGIVHLKDVVGDADPPYYVMSYAEGGSLAQRIEKGPMPLPEALRIFREVVQALAYVHAHGVRHCDLKPGNILIDALGRPVVADFGQAHLSNDATPALGTFFYMAPEQADLGHKIPDTRWDVYGLGALFYATLTGEPPRKDISLSGELSGTVELDHRLRRYREGIASTPAPTAHRRLPGMDKHLSAIIDGCLELDPKKRIPSAEGILNALEKRRVRRKQRPLLIYGLVAPLVVILLMAWAGFHLFDVLTNQSQANLQDQVMAGDKVLAQTIANGMERGLSNRIKALQDLLMSNSAEKLRGLIAQERSLRGGNKDLVGVQKQVNLWLEDVSKEKLSKINSSFSGLLAADAEGYIVANGIWDNEHNDPWHQNQAPATDNRSWRDWFSGGGNRPKGQKYPPISAPHISQPFVSKEKDHGRDRGVILCVSVPIRDGKNIIGVLTGSMTWKEFGRLSENVLVPKGKVAVFNQRGQAIKHRSEDANGRERDDVEDGVKAVDESDPLPAYPDKLAEQLKPDPDMPEMGQNNSFNDPFQRERTEPRLAGYKFFVPNEAEIDGDGPLGKKWCVVVEHRNAVLAPVNELNRSMQLYGLWMLVGAGALTGAIWVGLIWLLRREERLGHG